MKFTLRWGGTVAAELHPLAVAVMDALRLLEDSGCCPVLDDGLAAGNAAVLTPSGTLLVSPSGRRRGTFDADHAVELVTFDTDGWEAVYRSLDPATQPTSDAPLHHCALLEAARLGWSVAPGASLHGHVLDTTRAAEELELPISGEATQFSTPEDRLALVDLLRRAPYPEHRTVIRRDHGFFTLGADLADARRSVVALAEHARAARLLPSG